MVGNGCYLFLCIDSGEAGGCGGYKRRQKSSEGDRLDTADHTGCHGTEASSGWSSVELVEVPAVLLTAAPAGPKAIANRSCS